MNELDNDNIPFVRHVDQGYVVFDKRKVLEEGPRIVTRIPHLSILDLPDNLAELHKSHADLPLPIGCRSKPTQLNHDKKKKESVS
jgi:hypothetical protein